MEQNRREQEGLRERDNSRNDHIMEEQGDSVSNRIQNDEQQKNEERRLARRHRQFRYNVIDRIANNNDPALNTKTPPTTLDINLHCGYKYKGEIILPPLFKAMTHSRRCGARLTDLSIYNCDSSSESDISSSSIGSPNPSIWIALGQMLKVNTTLQQLTLRDCNLCWINVVPIFKALSKHTTSTLQYLNLSNNTQLFFCGSSRSRSTATQGAVGTTSSCLISKALRRCLTENSTLKVLNLSNTGLLMSSSNTMIIKDIFLSLEYNTTLESLNISHNNSNGTNKLVNDAATTLINLLIGAFPNMHGSNNGLQHLDIQGNHVSDVLDCNPTLMKKLVVSLSQNYTLWKLSPIILHSIEYYKNCQEEQDANTTTSSRSSLSNSRDSSRMANNKNRVEKQRQCFQYLNQINYLKCRNGLLASRVMKLSTNHIGRNSSGSTSSPFRVSLWCHILERIGNRSSKVKKRQFHPAASVDDNRLDRTSISAADDNDQHKFAYDMVYFLLQQKADILFRPRERRENVCNEEDNASVVANDASSQHRSSAKRKYSGSASTCTSKKQQKMKRILGKRALPLFKGDTVTCPGFYCHIHHRGENSRSLLPTECCNFETLDPFETKKKHNKLKHATRSTKLVPIKN